MKRTSRAGDDRGNETKRCRRTSPPPPAATAAAVVKGSPPPLRAKSTERVTSWLTGLPQRPQSLAPPDASGSSADHSPARSSHGSPPAHAALSSSPSARSSRPGPRDYRVQVLRRLDVRVDVDVEDGGRRRLLPPAPAGGLDEERVAAAARELHESARALLDRPTAGEDEWTALLSQAVRALTRAVPGRLCCLPNKAWSASLKPTTHIHQLGPPSPRRGSAPAPCRDHPAPNQAYPTPDHTDSPAPSGHPIPALLPARSDPLPSSAPVLRLEPAPPHLQPATPHPHLTVGLDDSDAAWAEGEHSWARPGLRGRDVKEILADLQHAARPDCGVSLTTDPCAASPSGLRFPFLTVHAKPATGGSIMNAENEAAVAAACALRIVADLSKSAPPDAAFEPRTFSLTAQGPVHDLWAHLPVGKGSHMIWLGAYRVTCYPSAEDLVRQLTLILRWGATDFSTWVKRRSVEYIDRLLNASH